jgi:hypothetical protein
LRLTGVLRFADSGRKQWEDAVETGGTERARSGIVPDGDDGMLVIFVLKREVFFILFSFATWCSDSGRQELEAAE